MAAKGTEAKATSMIDTMEAEQNRTEHDRMTRRREMNEYRLGVAWFPFFVFHSLVLASSTVCFSARACSVNVPFRQANPRRDKVSVAKRGQM